MKEKVGELFEQYIPVIAQQAQLTLPKLKKVNSTPELPKLKLPKLKKLETNE